jgi:hypothetical protein
VSNQLLAGRSHTKSCSELGALRLLTRQLAHDQPVARYPDDADVASCLRLHVNCIVQPRDKLNCNHRSG